VHDIIEHTSTSLLIYTIGEDPILTILYTLYLPELPGMAGR